jgi:hypothetical protein
MESIGDSHKKLVAKRQQAISSTNSVINRLATPKNQRDAVRRRFQ